MLFFNCQTLLSGKLQRAYFYGMKQTLSFLVMVCSNVFYPLVSLIRHAFILLLLSCIQSTRMEPLHKRHKALVDGFCTRALFDPTYPSQYCHNNNHHKECTYVFYTLNEISCGAVHFSVCYIPQGLHFHFRHLFN